MTPGGALEMVALAGVAASWPPRCSEAIKGGQAPTSGWAGSGGRSSDVQFLDVLLAERGGDLGHEVLGQVVGGELVVAVVDVELFRVSVVNGDCVLRGEPRFDLLALIAAAEPAAWYATSRSACCRRSNAPIRPW